MTGNKAATQAIPKSKSLDTNSHQRKRRGRAFKTVKTKLLKFGSVVPELTNKESKKIPNEKTASKINTEQDEIQDHYQQVLKENYVKKIVVDYNKGVTTGNENLARSRNPSLYF